MSEAKTMLDISKKIKKIKPSITLAVTAKANEMKKQGHDVIGFGAGEPDFDTPENIKNAAKAALDKGFTKYTPSGGTLELKKAVQLKFKRDNALDYELNQIIINSGAKHSLYNVFQVILDPGDEVIIPAPFWVSYPDMVLLADGVPVIVNTKEEHNFELDIADLEKYITKKTKAIVINSPSNPTGCVYSPEKLQKIAAYLEDKNVFVISDEIYEHLVYDGAFTTIAGVSPKIKEKTIVVNGVSKAYSMTGWRIGYTAGPANVIKGIDVVQSQSTSNPTSISQWATVEALTGDQSFIQKMKKSFAERRDYIVERLNGISGLACRKPAGAFYVFPKTKALYGKSYNG
jgi:aspartate aminotransferase